MAYCLKADIEKAYPSADLTQLTDDEGDSSKVTERVNDAITKADAIIDSYLRAHHSVPLSSPPEEIERASIDLSYFFLVKRRRATQDDPAVDGIYDRIEKWLVKVAKGIIKINDTTSFVNTAGRFKSNKTSTSKIYDADYMKKFTVNE